MTEIEKIYRPRALGKFVGRDISDYLYRFVSEDTNLGTTHKQLIRINGANKFSSKGITVYEDELFGQIRGQKYQELSYSYDYNTEKEKKIVDDLFVLYFDPEQVIEIDKSDAIYYKRSHVYVVPMETYSDFDTKKYKYFVDKKTQPHNPEQDSVKNSNRIYYLTEKIKEMQDERKELITKLKLEKEHMHELSKEYWKRNGTD